MTTSNPSPVLARDPVCGMNVNPDTARYTAEHSGKKYFFCCGNCADKFLTHPSGYVNRPAPGLVTLGMPIRTRRDRSSSSSSEIPSAA